MTDGTITAETGRDSTTKVGARPFFFDIYVTPVDANTLVIIGSNIVGWAALGGYLWSSVGTVEKKVDRGFKEVNARLDAQNGRIGKLELWKAERSAYQRGWEDRNEREDW